MVLYRRGCEMNERVKMEIEGGVADVRLARPEKLNALDARMFEALAKVGAELAAHHGVRAVVISGEGRAFCVGLDRERIAAVADGRPLLPCRDLTKRTHGLANFVQHVVWQWRELAVPVIAAVHGIAFGGGFQLALSADFRIAAPNAEFSILEAKWGLVPDMAGIHLMRHLGREDVVRELTYTARTFTAEEAAEYGFVSRLVDDPHSEAMVVAGEIAGRSPDAIRAAKRLLNLATAGDVDTILLAETAEQMRLLGSVNQVEAVKANLAARKARFADPKPPVSDTWPRPL
jgi:enoyl-CoA hydratase/carnithine racemase